jgi:hypothetical protein
MIFETLYQSAINGELMLVENGICHWHLRRDKQITIREIISLKTGQGSLMLNKLTDIAREHNATSIFAKCPADLAANEWYKRRGFAYEGTETTKTGRELKLWRLQT